MKKYGIFLLVAFAFLKPAKAEAYQFVIPSSVQSSTVSINASIVLPTVNWLSQNCINHVTVTSGVSAMFNIISNPLNVAYYQVNVFPGRPFDSQWGSYTALCASPGASLTLRVTGSNNYIISAETFVKEPMGISVSNTTNILSEDGTPLLMEDGTHLLLN